MIDPDTQLDIHYPDRTLIEKCSELKLRRIHVTRVRDLVADPLSPAEYLRRPMIRRSRWLVHAFDETNQAWRKFYLGSTQEFESPGSLRLALYEPETSRPYRILTRPFGDTHRDRRILAKVVADLNKQDHGELMLRILADDFRLVG